ncbi:MAG: hypothetical protein ACFFDU_10935 [Candidatus Thorarchaeota archaeon]
MKGGKWTYGWVFIDSQGCVPIPPQAWVEYDFSVEDEYLVFPGSRTSGGFSITTRRRLKHRIPMPVMTGVVFEGQYCLRFSLPLLAQLKVNIGDRLLVVRGSGFALGFVKQGRIVDEAEKHTDLPVFQCGM